MLTGEVVTLRPVREADLADLYEAHINISSRGNYFPLGIRSESAYRRDFADTGFWRPEEGMLLMWNRDGDMVGHIEFFKPVAYWDAYELSYQLYDQRHSGKGYTTEAVQLMVDYLFATKQRHRIHLVIVPENTASRRVAEKCGFTDEGITRGAFYNDGRNHDVVIYSLLRTDPRPWHPGSDPATVA